eukprot:4694852-Amphidinium_carterae.1
MNTMCRMIHESQPIAQLEAKRDAALTGIGSRCNKVMRLLVSWGQCVVFATTGTLQILSTGLIGVIEAGSRKNLCQLAKRPMLARTVHYIPLLAKASL